jgi:hypothetical protein
VIVLAVDYADLGNLALGIGTSISGYVAATGNVPLSVFVLSMAGVVKAIFSALDNFVYKKTTGAVSTAVVAK